MTYRSTATTTRWQPWTFRDESWHSADLTDFKVEARDGEIGKIDSATYELDGSYLIVDTGPWIFGKKVMLPAGVVNAVDMENRVVLVDRSKEQIKNAPEFDHAMLNDAMYRERLGTYYGEEGQGWYDRDRGF
jgi:hypothetical protein